MKKIFATIVIGITALMMGFLIFDGGSSDGALNLVFASESATKVYDGVELISHEWSLKQGELEKGHEAVVSFTASQTNVGTVSNEFTVKIIDKDGDDLSSYYTIEYEYGKLTVNARKLTILSGSSEKIYDGLELKNETYEITEGTLPKGHKIVADFKASICDVGTCINYFEAKIYKGNEDVTSNFNLTLESGSLSIKARPIVLASKSASKIYDGKNLECEDLEFLNGSLAENHILSTNFLNSIINVGTVTNDFEVKIFDGSKDVSSNYSITLSSGKLSVLPRNITIASDSATKIYDGEELKAESWKLIDGELIGIEDINVSYLKSIINFGTTSNDINVEIYLNGEVVSHNYKISLVPGILTVTRREITITSLGKEKLYDGLPLINEEYEISTGEIVNGQSLEIDFKNSITNVGDISNFFEVKILSEEEDVTSNYNILMNYGILKVTSKNITITSASSEKAYDGTELKCEEYNITEGEILSNHNIEVEFLSSITNVGNISNSIGVKIYDGDNDVTSNYNILTSLGKLTITTCNLEIKLLDGSKVYDGTEFKHEEYEIIDGTLPENHEISIEYINSITNVGTTNNDGNIKVLLNEEDVSYNFTITKEKGTLEITKRPITVTSADAVKIYDGTELSSAEYEITSGTIAENQSIEYSDTVTILNVGTLANTVTCTILDSEENDVTKNYEISFVEGILEITKRPITVTSSSETKVYDGIGLSSSVYEISDGVLVDNHSILYSDKVSIINVGTLESTVTCTILDSEENDVTENYQITIEEGVLEVTKRNITVTTPSSSKTYDGTELIANDYQITNGVLAENQSIVYSNTVSIKDAGLVYNTVKCNIFDEKDNDVSLNYNIFIENGTLEVFKRSITITSEGASKVYDGTELKRDNYLITSGTLAENQSITYINPISITDVGTSTNYIKFAIYSDDNVNVSSNYDVTLIEGTLEISPRHITITTGSASKVYDGLELSCEEYSIISGSIADNQTIEYFGPKSISNVEVVENSITAIIKDINEKIVTSNYDILYINGLLEIFPCKITITTGSANKVYDGNKLICDEWNLISGTIPDNHDLYVKVIGSITNVGECDNELSVSIEYQSLNALENFEIEYSLGKLVVSPIDIMINSASDKKTYDGTPLTNDTINVYGDVLSGHTISAEAVGTIVDVGTASNIIAWNIVDENNIQVDDNYNVTLKEGILEIVPIEIAVVSSDASKNYDGTPLVCPEYTVVGLEKLLENHTIEVTVSGTITEIGKVNNIITCVDIYDENHEIVTYNYKINKYEGKLEIKEDVNNSGSGGEGGGGDDGSGSGLASGSNGNLANNPFEQSDIPVFKIKADTDGMIYFKNASMGNYSLYKWENAKNDFDLTSAPFNPNYLAAKSLEQNGISSNTVLIEPLVEGLDYLSPNYSAEYLNETEYESHIRGKLTTSVSAPYMNYTFSPSNNYQIGEEYANFENKYYQYVLNNYLQLPNSTKNVMLELAERNNLNANSFNIIAEVANYISNAGEYNMEFEPIPEGEDIAVYFLTKSREGICQHFATAGVAMFRALGFPARYTTGFVSETVKNETVTVSSKSAHAWVEVYIKGFGWITVEVTGGSNDGFSPGGGAGGEGDSSEKKNKLSIKPIRVNHYYDGNEVYALQEVSGLYTLLSLGYTYDCVISGSRTELGITETTIDLFTLYAPSGEDVTSKFDIDYQRGIIQVHKGSLAIKTNSHTKVYDGLPIYDTQWSYSGELLPGDYIDYTTVSFPKLESNVGEWLNMVTFDICNSKGEIITDHYYLDYSNIGKFEINAREIIIKTGSATKKFDNKYLTCSDYEVFNMAESDTIKVTLAGKQKNIGSSDNKVGTVLIINKNNGNAISNYKITYILGKLTVTYK